MHKIKQIAFANASFIEADSRNFEIVIELLVRAESDMVSMFYTDPSFFVPLESSQSPSSCSIFFPWIL